MTLCSIRRGIVLVELVGVLICGIFTGCSHSPSYSDIKVEKGGSLANANTARPQTVPSAGQADPVAPVAGSSPAAAASSLPLPDFSPSTGPSASPTATPAFFDQKTGQIRNLPLYPRSKVMGVQYGPINGTSQALMQAICTAPFEKVTAFYEAVIKDNGWIVEDNSRGANSYIWQLSRGQTDRGAIRVDKDERGYVHIALARTN